MKIAIIHDFLTQLGGAERVLDAFLEIWPKAPVYTLVYDQKKLAKFYGKFDIKTSFLQKLPLSVKKHKWYLVLMPKATESYNLSEYDVVLSITSAFAKGVVTKKPTVHICYINTPTRYLWSDRDSYLKSAPIPGFIQPLMPMVIKNLQKWDLKAAKRPDYYIANSENINQRMQKYYNRRADQVIWPPVNGRKFKISSKIGDYFFLVSRAEPYKKTDLVIKVFNKLGSKYKLKIAGTGTSIEALKDIAKANIEFLGRVPDDKLADLYASSLALVFPQKEDAGITMLESMASGRPVLAYRAGGAKEIVIPGKTGEFFDEQTVESIMETVSQFNSDRYNPSKIRKHALKYDKEIFKEKIENFINKILTEEQKNRRTS